MLFTKVKKTGFAFVVILECNITAACVAVFLTLQHTPAVTKMQ